MICVFIRPFIHSSVRPFVHSFPPPPTIFPFFRWMDGQTDGWTNEHTNHPYVVGAIEHRPLEGPMPKRKDYEIWSGASAETVADSVKFNLFFIFSLYILSLLNLSVCTPQLKLTALEEPPKKKGENGEENAIPFYRTPA